VAQTGQLELRTVDRLVIHDERRRPLSRKFSAPVPASSAGSSSAADDNWLSHYSRHYLQPGGGEAWPVTEDEDDAMSTYRSDDSSTPEPPLSTRPKNLDNADQVQSRRTTTATRDGQAELLHCTAVISATRIIMRM